MPPPKLLWFRQDLRLADNRAVTAVAGGGPVLAVFVLDDEAAGGWALGGASRWWLHHSLRELSSNLLARGVQLLFRKGSAATIVPQLAEEAGAAEVHAGLLTEPWARVRDEAIARTLEQQGRRLIRHRNALLHDPWAVRTKAGGPFGVYTPFSRACVELGVDTWRSVAPERFDPAVAGHASDELDDWALLPRTPDWTGGLRDTWRPGEAGAQERLTAFIEQGFDEYGEDRNRPDLPSTSMLSPHLHWGELSPAAAWCAAAERAPPPAKPKEWLDTFRKELLWREFSYHLLWHRPDMPEAPLRAQFESFPWRHDPAALRAWQRGMTGYPIVDAGMRQLWQTGWMHNRVRMITASFLVKHLLLPWQEGEAWFWDTLVDADLASNSASWQWVAGCGADAAPYFRIFNPMLQGAKFDPNGDYVRRFVPELAHMPLEFVHAPWQAPALVLREAGVELGRTYPYPIVDHDEARRRALAALAEISSDAA